MKLRCLLAVCFFMTAAALAEVPAALTLRFDFFYNGIRAAEVTEVFVVDGDNYRIESHAAAVGIAKLLYGDVVRKSTGRLDDNDGLQVRYYEEQRGRRMRTEAVVDAAAGVVRLQRGEEQRREMLPPETLTDYLTAIYRPYVLATIVAGKTALTDGWRLKVYDYMFGEEEMISTEVGDFVAVPLIRNTERGVRVVWFSAAAGYIPIKSRIEDKGHTFETVLTGIGK